jgi:nucleotide-binding universal stress UspA family protein
MLPFTRILFPLDFSERCRAAAPFVLSMAQRYKSKVFLIHAFEAPPPMYGGLNTIYPDTYDFAGMENELRLRVTDFARTELPGVDTECAVEMGSPATVVGTCAEANGADLIAMPTHGYGTFRRMLLGSVTAKVLHDMRIPVWTDAHAPEPWHRAHPRPRHILAALDLKADSYRTLEAALELGRDAKATVEIVHAAAEGEITPLHSESRIRELVAAAAGEQAVTVEQPATEVEIVVDQGSVAKIVRSVALRKRSDLIVIGRGAIQGAASRLAANSYAIVREAPCPVLSV